MSLARRRRGQRPGIDRRRARQSRGATRARSVRQLSASTADRERGRERAPADDMRHDQADRRSSEGRARVLGRRGSRPGAARDPAAARQRPARFGPARARVPRAPHARVHGSQRPPVDSPGAGVRGRALLRLSRARNDRQGATPSVDGYREARTSCRRPTAPAPPLTHGGHAPSRTASVQQRRWRDARSSPDQRPLPPRRSCPSRRRQPPTTRNATIPRPSRDTYSGARDASPTGGQRVMSDDMRKFGAKWAFFSFPALAFVPYSARH